MTIDEINRWREAHPNLQISDEALAALDGFPSLAANDYAFFLEAAGHKDAAEFVRKLREELVWAYDNWTKARRESHPELVIESLLNDATTPEYGFTRRFIQDYAKSHNIRFVPR